MADVPKLVTNWRRVTWTVISSIRENADRIAPKIQRDLYPDDPEGDQVRTAYLARASCIERKLDVLEARALALLAERGDNAALIRELDEATTALRQVVIRTRSFAAGSFEPELLEQLGLTGDTPRDARALRMYAANSSSQLRKVALPETSAEALGASFDGARSATLIEAGLTRLDAALAAIAQDGREDETALRERDEAEEDLRYSYIGAADLFAADAVAAGHRKIADRVRPTARRREGVPEDTDVDPTLVTGPT